MYNSKNLKEGIRMIAKYGFRQDWDVAYTYVHTYDPSVTILFKGKGSRTLKLEE